MVRVSLIIGFLSLGCFSVAQSIEGVLLDACDRSPLIGAHVILLSDWSMSAITDIEGRFKLNTTSPDSILLTYVGYEEKVIAVSGKEDQLIILLQPAAEQMETLEVSAERIIAEEFTVKKIQRLEIYKNPNAKADPLLAVGSLPSATTLDESANISFRGSSPGETGIFLNNVPIYDAVRFSQLNGIGTFSIFNTNLVNAVYVFPGNPPLEYGNTTSGLISIMTGEELPAYSSTEVNVSMASLGLFHKRKLGPKDRHGITAFGNYQPSSLLTAVNQEALSDIPWFVSADVGLQYTGRLKPNLKLKAFNYSLFEGYDFRFFSPSYEGLFLQRKKRNLSVINLVKFFEHATLSFNGGYHVSNVTFDYSQFDQQLATQDSYLSINFHKIKHRIEWKVGIAYDRRNQVFDGLVPKYDFALQPSHPTLLISSIEKRNLLDGFAFFKYRPSERISFGYAVRANAPLDDFKSFVSYQTVIQFAPSMTHQILFSTGRYHRYRLPQPDVFPLVHTRQMSVDYRWKQAQYTISTSLFSKEARSEQQVENIKGVESAVNFKINRKLKWDISYTFMDAQQENDGMPNSPGRYDLDYFVRSGLEWTLSRYWTISSRLLWRQGTYVPDLIAATYEPDLNVYVPKFGNIDVASERLPYYQSFDFSVSRLFQVSESANGVVFANISNMLDRENIRGLTYSSDFLQEVPQLLSRRTFYAGIVLIFQ